MSAALQFPALAQAAAAQRQAAVNRQYGARGPEAAPSHYPDPEGDAVRYGFGPQPEDGTLLEAALAEAERDRHRKACPAPPPTLAFYHKHTQALLRRYLYASMLVGRAPTVLKEPLMRGWASYRPVRTFEDCVIFVLDMESALARLTAMDRLMLTRIVLQEYSIAETALLFNRRHKVVCQRLTDALDRLTQILLDNGTLKVPRRAEDMFDE